MNNLMKGARLVVLFVACVLAGCASNANEPKSLQQQQAMAKGYAPTKEQLATAMSHFKAPPQAPQHP